MSNTTHVVVYLGPEDQHWFGPDGTQFNLRNLSQMRDSKEILFTAYPPEVIRHGPIRGRSEFFAYCMSMHGMEIASTNLYNTMKRIDDFKQTFENAYYNREGLEIEEIPEYAIRPYNVFTVSRY